MPVLCRLSSWRSRTSRRRLLILIPKRDQGGDLFALVSWWQLPDDTEHQSVIELAPSIGPIARRAPGFREGYWTYEPQNGKSVGFMLVDSAEDAYDLRNALENHMEAQDDPAVQLEMIRVQEVVARVP